MRKGELTPWAAIGRRISDILEIS